MMVIKTVITMLGASATESEVISKELMGTVHGLFSKRRCLNPTPDPLG